MNQLLQLGAVFPSQKFGSRTPGRVPFTDFHAQYSGEELELQKNPVLDLKNCIDVQRYLSLIKKNQLTPHIQKLFENLVKLDPTDEELLYYLGLCHQWSHDPGKYQKAREHLEKLLTINPQHSKAISTLAELLRTGAEGVPANPVRAKALLERAINSGNTHESLYFTLAHLLIKGGPGLDPSPLHAYELLESLKSEESSLSWADPFLKEIQSEKDSRAHH